MADKNAESTIKKWVATQSKEIMEKSKLLINLDEVEEKEASWLIPGYLPKGQICIMCGDGGAGKTTTWCALAASVSTGGKVFFDQTPDEFVKAEPQKVLFFSSEDSIEYVLRAKLRKSGANLKNIFSVSLKNPQFADVKFNSSLLKDIVAEVKPALARLDLLIPAACAASSNSEVKRLPFRRYSTINFSASCRCGACRFSKSDSLTKSASLRSVYSSKCAPVSSMVNRAVCDSCP